VALALSPKHFPCYNMVMSTEEQYDYVLIRDAAILVRIRRLPADAPEETGVDLFDVRTGVQLRCIHPTFQLSELDRGYPVSEECASAVIAGGVPAGIEAGINLSKVVSILGVKQRRLDAVVADSILDQVRVVSDLLNEFLQVADAAEREERLWMSQQILSLVRKFSGRELEELRSLLEWLRAGRKK
jgi:hypothetical protein